MALLHNMKLTLILNQLYNIVLQFHITDQGESGGAVEWNSKKTGMRDENCIGMDIEEG